MATTNDDDGTTLLLPLSQFITFKNQGEATALVHWLEAYWLPSQRRKHPTLQFCLAATTAEPQLQIHSQSSNDKANSASTKDATIWGKQLSAVLKKITIEDLGDMNAVDLWDSIPETDDRDGRGRGDLMTLQKELQVHVEFSGTSASGGHVYLVGNKAKLSKKCFTLRNILSHYHWRLSGKDTRK